MTSQDGNELVKKIIDAFKRGEFDVIAALVQKALDEGAEPVNLLDNGLTVGIRAVGEQFRRGEVYLPEMMMSAEAWQESIVLLDPLLTADNLTRKSTGKVVIGTVKGDIHSLGKNIVVTMLKAAGFDVIDLGEDVPASKFVEGAERHHADIIAASALMTTTMPQQKEIINHLEARGKRQDYYVIVGGGCTSAEWTKEIKADAYGETAAEAIALVEVYMESLKRGGRA